MTHCLNGGLDLNSAEVINVLDEVPFWSAPFGIKLLEQVGLKPGITALDIGFGTGFPLTELAMSLGNSCKVYGLDPWQAAADRAKSKLRVYGINNVELLNNSAEEIPLEDASIDLVVSNNGLNNVNDLGQSIRECSRVMKPGAQFVQTVNLETSMVEFYQVLEEVLLEENLSDFVPGIQKHIREKRLPLNDYINLLEQNGFEINSVVHDRFSYKFVDGTCLLNHYFIRLAFLPSWVKLVPDNQANVLFSKVEAKMNTMARSNGYIELSVPFVVIDCIRK